MKLVLGLTIKRCDNCGRLNPPIYKGNPRLCGVCISPDGFYDGANGKIGRWRIQFPFAITWRGWWRL